MKILNINIILFSVCIKLDTAMNVVSLYGTKKYLFRRYFDSCDLKCLSKFVKNYKLSHLMSNIKNIKTNFDSTNL